MTIQVQGIIYSNVNRRNMILQDRLIVKYDISFLIIGRVSGVDVQYNCLLWLVKGI